MYVVQDWGVMSLTRSGVTVDHSPSGGVANRLHQMKEAKSLLDDFFSFFSKAWILVQKHFYANLARVLGFF